MKFSKKNIKLLKNLAFILFIIVTILTITNIFLDSKIIEGHKGKKNDFRTKNLHFLLNIFETKKNKKFCDNVSNQTLKDLIAKEQLSVNHLNDDLKKEKQTHFKKNGDKPITKNDINNMRDKFKKKLLDCKFK
jgi:hypothetical protein